MEKMRNILDHTLEILSGVSFLAMVVLTCWQVFTRYLLKNPSSWSEELVFGASLVTGERGHMNIPLLTERLGPGLKKGLAVFSETVALLFSVVILFYGGMKITDLAMGQMTSSLGLPVGFFYAVLPVSGVLCVVYTGLNLWEILKTGREG